MECSDISDDLLNFLWQPSDYNRPIEQSQMSTRSTRSYGSVQNAEGNVLKGVVGRFVLSEILSRRLGLVELAEFRKGKRGPQGVYEFDGVFQYNNKEKDLPLKDFFQILKSSFVQRMDSNTDESAIQLKEFKVEGTNREIPRIKDRCVILFEVKSRLTPQQYEKIQKKKPEQVKYLFEDLREKNLEPCRAYLVIIHNGAHPETERQPDRLFYPLPQNNQREGMRIKQALFFCGMLYFNYSLLWKGSMGVIKNTKDGIFNAYMDLKQEIKIFREENAVFREENAGLKEEISKLKQENFELKKDISNINISLARILKEKEREQKNSRELLSPNVLIGSKKILKTKRQRHRKRTKNL